ncbi:MAG: hypothetical protein KatS3mg124_0880 [Porticoccaceae bacterium]|nr:MAG: hypothetical protein KatS3mg124_0880 [Porticoccaceae bacterium]
MKSRLVVSVTARDRPGIVERLAATIRSHGGNWLESALARLGGRFAGVVLAEVAEAEREALISALTALPDLEVSVRPDDGDGPPAGRRVEFSLVGNDRPGIVDELARSLASRGISFEELQSRTESAPMSGERLFRARARVVLPEPLAEEDLRRLLEALSDDLMVEFPED